MEVTLARRCPAYDIDRAISWICYFRIGCRSSDDNNFVVYVRSRPPNTAEYNRERNTTRNIGTWKAKVKSSFHAHSPCTDVEHAESNVLVSVQAATAQRDFDVETSASLPNTARTKPPQCFEFLVRFGSVRFTCRCSYRSRVARAVLDVPVVCLRIILCVQSVNFFPSEQQTGNQKQLTKNDLVSAIRQHKGVGGEAFFFFFSWFLLFFLFSFLYLS